MCKKICIKVERFEGATKNQTNKGILTFLANYDQPKYFINVKQIKQKNLYLIIQNQ